MCQHTQAHSIPPCSCREDTYTSSLLTDSSPSLCVLPVPHVALRPPHRSTHTASHSVSSHTRASPHRLLTPHTRPRCVLPNPATHSLLTTPHLGSLSPHTAHTSTMPSHAAVPFRVFTPHTSTAIHTPQPYQQTPHPY